jgi:hypothetical protein
MLAMLPTNIQASTNDQETIVGLVERIAGETASLPNRLAWREIFEKLRVTGRSSSRANELRGEVWAVRKRNAATKRAARPRSAP